ncbi:MAG TPA: hypothetical protein VG843_07590 [Rhizomicrobium sp.]|jgi:hypothetical protein|nr:hypothetical protein [Rhizomicrobium sp.]
MSWQQLAPYLFPLLIVVLIARRALSAQTPRRVRTSRLWIGPVYLAVGMVLVLATSPMPNLFGALLFVAGAAAGAVVGYLRALHQEFSIEADTGNVMSKATPLGSILFLGLFVVRFGLNSWFRAGSAPGSLQARSAEIVLYTDTMLFFAFAMVTVSAWEVWRRTRPLVAAHKAAQAPPPAREAQD